MTRLFLLVSVMILTTFSSAFADDLYQEDAAGICKAQTSSSRSDQCMKHIKSKKYDTSALRYCGTQKYWNKLKDCLSVIENKYFDTKAFTLCTSGTYFNEQQRSCVRKIADKEFVSTVEVGVCEQKKSSTQQRKCILAASTKKYVKTDEPEEEKDAMSRVEIVQKIKQAYGLLRDNKNTDATLVLHDLIKNLENETTVQ